MSDRSPAYRRHLAVSQARPHWNLVGPIRAFRFTEPHCKRMFLGMGQSCYPIIRSEDASSDACPARLAQSASRTAHARDRRQPALSQMTPSRPLMDANPFWGICDHGAFCQHRRRRQKRCGEGAAGAVAGEACHRSRQRDFRRLDGVARRGADKARYFD